MGILVRSEDRGATWKTLSMGPPGDNSATFVQFGRHDPTAAYLTTVDHGIFAYTIARDAPVDAVEFYNSLLDHYFMTAAAEEADGIDHGAAGPGWSRTGYSFRAWLSSTASAPTVRPACRFYGTPGRGPNSHFYTIDPAECAAVRNDPGWRLEATDVFYASRPASDGCASDKKAVYRAYNNRFTQNDSNHRYAAAPAAYDQVLARGWSAEGVVMCAEP
jgi:serine protease